MMWEYKWVSGTYASNTTEELNALGRERWEAVGIGYVDWSVRGDISGNEGDVSGEIKTDGGETYVLLKRSLPE